MNNFFDKLNLRPQERRLVVVVAIVVFVIVNFWLVFPMFCDYGKYQQRIKDEQTRVDRYNGEINKQNSYKKQLVELLDSGTTIATEDAALRLYQEVNSQANLTGLGYTLITPVTRGGNAKTNAFFDETSVTVNIRTGEKELVDFLNRLTDKELMIRARSMDLSPDPSRMLLQGSITLVKSYQRKPPAKVAAAPTTIPKSNAAPAAAKAAAKPAVPASTPAAKVPAPAPAADTKKPSRQAPAAIAPPASAATNRAKRAP